MFLKSDSTGSTTLTLYTEAKKEGSSMLEETWYCHFISSNVTIKILLTISFPISFIMSTPNHMLHVTCVHVYNFISNVFSPFKANSATSLTQVYMIGSTRPKASSFHFHFLHKRQHET